MDLRTKLYQLIINRLDGDRIPDEKYQDILISLVRKGIGGFINFGGRKDIVAPFIEKLQSISAIPLFIASDIERGVGQQIEGYTNFPSQMAVRASVNRDNPGDIAILRDAVRALALEAMDAGINMPLIPVLDVNSNPENPIICTRAFSDDPADVAFFGAEYIKGLEGLGLISCAKHFPGHGDTSTDSHISLPVIKKSYDELFHTDIRPFEEAVKTGVSSVMIGHLLIPSVDGTNPSSLSKGLITGVLRTRIGFNGLIMTDALNMSAISGIENVAARCLNAGVDIILHPSDAEMTVRELADAVSSGLISPETIDAAVERISEAKSRITRIQKEAVDLNSHARLSGLIAERSVTIVKNDGILPMMDADRIHVIIAGEDSLCNRSLWLKQYSRGFLTPSGFPDETVIIAIFSRVAAWRGSAGIDDRVVGQVTDRIRKAGKSIVISFGSPYLLRHFKEAGALVAAYDANVPAQDAVIKCLKGEILCNGRLPVRL